MAELTDHELLTRFACTGEEAAFAAFVTRHVNLVWSAARRFTGDDTLASEVTQAVFIILAQKAGGISAKSVLTGWLYQTARLTAANALKENCRRQQREHQAYMEATLTPNETNEAWQQLAPVLDEAMHALRTADRDAVLLRFFENKTLADVGAALGVTEDAARVRVNRALDKLRALLAKQGIKFGATAIATAVAANAVSAAPAALAASITTAVLTGTSLTLATIAMTTLQKIAVTAALTVTIGGGLFAAKQAHDAQNTVRALQAQQAPTTEQLQQLQAERDKATNQIAGLKEELANTDKNNLELLKLRGELTLLKAASKGALDTEANDLLAKVNSLKQKFEESPKAKIPEMELLTDQAWFETAGKKLDTDTDYRRAMAHLRTLAKDKVAGMYCVAVNKYILENKGQFPTDMNQLKPFLTTPLADSILSGWKIVSTDHQDRYKSLGNWIITETDVEDDVFDSIHAVARLWVTLPYLAVNPATIITLKPVSEAYSAANNGTNWTGGDPSVLLPFATTPEQIEVVQKIIMRESD